MCRPWEIGCGVLRQQKYSACLAFPREQPFNTLHKLPTDPKQDRRRNLQLATFHRGEVVRAGADTFLVTSCRVIFKAGRPP